MTSLLIGSMAAAFILSWAGVWLWSRNAARLGFMDFPNPRSSHGWPTPRAGGLAFVASMVLVFVAATRAAGIQVVPGLWFVLGGGLLVAAVSLADDRRQLRARVRLAAQLLGALVLLLGGLRLVVVEWPESWSLPLGLLTWPMTILWIVGLTNVYNFMDGIDGIATGQGIVAAVGAASIAMAHGDGGLAVLLLILASSLGGFLIHNWPPAGVFMGDVGSAFLGFTFAGLAISVGGRAGGAVPFAVWVVLLAPFLFDSGLTLLTRILRGERWYEAHRKHLYQRLVRAGWSHQSTTLTYLVMDVALAALMVAHFVFGIGNPVAVLAAAMLPLVLLVVLVRRVEASRAATAAD